MVAYNFKAIFAADVENRQKCQTIRAKRKDGRRPYPGDDLQLYTGMRTKSCRKLRDAVCSMVRDIKIKENGTVKIDGQVLGRAPVEDLAIADGFTGREPFIAFFRDTHGLPFEGHLINWTD